MSIDPGFIFSTKPQLDSGSSITGNGELAFAAVPPFFEQELTEKTEMQKGVLCYLRFLLLNLVFRGVTVAAPFRSDTA